CDILFHSCQLLLPLPPTLVYSSSSLPPSPALNLSHPLFLSLPPPLPQSLSHSLELFSSLPPSPSPSLCLSLSHSPLPSLSLSLGEETPSMEAFSSPAGVGWLPESCSIGQLF